MKAILSVCICLYLCAACHPPYPPEVATSLRYAGSNRSELEKLIGHYQDDSFKTQTAYFLIAHSRLHQTYDSPQKAIYDRALFNSIANQSDSVVLELPFTHPLVSTIMDSLNEVYGVLNDFALEKQSDVHNLSAKYLVEHIDQAFTAWKTYPWAQEYSFEQFCEYILPYRASDEPIEDWHAPMRKKFEWLSDSLSDDSSPEEVCSLINRHLQLTANIAFTQYPVAQPLSIMQKARMGTCREQVNLAMFAMRTHGLAIAHDFTPTYANYHTGHDWNALITPTGESYDFLGTLRSPKQHYLWWKAAKVYRHTFSAQSTFPFDEIDQRNTPSFFMEKTLKDVTSEYFPVSDITMKLTAQDAQLSKIAYLCTFGDREWYPIHWGRVAQNGKVRFTDMGRGYQSEDDAPEPVADDLLYFTQINEGKGIVYTPMEYKERQLQAIGPALILNLDGTINSLAPDTIQRQDLILKRKYPETLRKQGWRKHLVGCIFQAANRADFSDAQTLFAIDEVPGEYINIAQLNSRKPFRYVRLSMNQDTISSIAEISFFNAADESLSGDLIYEGEFSYDGPPQAAIDKDPLTYTEGISGDNYVGWDFRKPVTISKLSYLARNDGNAIQPGDRYELLYWDEEWMSLGKKRADTTFLAYSNAPDNALFWLRNLSQGREERIFTYEGGKQVWW